MIEEIIKKYPNEEILIFDNFNEAIIGFDEKKMTVVYSIKKCIDILQKDGLNYKEAKEFFYYNTYDTYIGEKTPIFKNDIN